MPRLATPPRGSTQDRLAAMLVTTITLVRDGAVLGDAEVYLDFTAKGREQLLGSVSLSAAGNMGFGGIVEGVTIAAAADADLAVADVFAHGGAQYTIEYVSPIGESHASGDVLRMAWASASRAA